LPLVTFTRVRTRALVPVVATPALLLALAACGGGDSTAPPVPELLTKTAGDGVAATVAQPTSTAPTLKVTDKNGRAVTGVVVNFAVANGGSIAAAVDTTDASGLATSGTWTLGTAAGPQTVTATSPSVAGASAVFTVTATAGAPRSLVFATQPPTFAEAGQPFTGPVVEARDAYGNRSSSSISVTLTLAGNTGQVALTGTTTVTVVDGRATFGQLTTTATGALSFVATASDQNIGAAISNAMQVSSGPVAAIAKVSGDLQMGDAGTSAFLPPVARVTDAFGNPKGGTQVTFSVISGGGSVSNTTATSGADGLVRVDRWTLGPSAGANVVRAMTGNIQADFAATALAPTPYHIELRYVNLPTRRQQEAFESAWRKWRGVITGDIPNFSWAGGSACGRNIPAEVIDDLVIYVNLAPIDGPNNILGSAGPCAFSTGNLMPFFGNMTFDIADLESLENAGQLDQVIVHEMGHVLGIGIGQLWDPKGLRQFAGTDSVSFNGAAARAVWQSLGGAAGTRVPMENCVGYSASQCGPGTRDSHWRERTFNNELMTGFLNGGIANPLSALTIAALQDFGYTVNTAVAETYSLPAALMAGGSSGSGSSGGSIGSLRRLVEGEPTWEMLAVDRGGRAVPVEQWMQEREARARRLSEQ
jgi:Leishmanolysin